MFARAEPIKLDRRIMIFMGCAIIAQCALLMILFYQESIIFLALIVAPVLIFAIVKKPFFGLCILTIIAFSNLGMWTSTVVIRIVTVITFAGFLLRMLFKNQKIQGSKQFAFLTIFCIAAFLSFFVARDMSLWTKGMVRLISVFLFFLFIVNLIKTKKQLWIVIRIIVITVTAGAVYGIYFFRKVGFISFLVSTGSLVRGGSFVPDANVWAVSLLAAIPLTIATMIKEEKRTYKILLFFAVMFQVISLFTTFSRGGIVALSIIIMCIILKMMKRKALGFSVLLLVFFAAYVLLPPFVILRVKTLLSLFQQKPLQDYSLMGRFYLMKAALRMFLDHPIMGVGLFNFIANSGSYCLGSLRKVTHSIYLEIATGTGLLGFVPFMMVLYFSFRDYFISRKRFSMSGNGELAELSFYALLSLLGVAIAGIFLSIEFSRPLWFLISFSVVLSTMSSQAEFRNG